jgi:CheY-like chemotaxis protein
MAVTTELEIINILLVEDNPGDVRLTEEARRDFKVSNRVSVVNDGESAIEYLRREGQYLDADPVHLVLLDLNLPKKDGREVLSEIKSDSSLRRTPVVVLTTSRDEADVLRSYDLHANAYVTKPIDLDQFTEVIHAIEDFWLAVVRLPSGASWA